MSKIWEKDRLYSVLRPYVDACTKYSYNKAHVRGSLPEDGAVIIAPNHTSTLMDALVILRSRKAPTVFGARADIFAKPLAARILRFLRILPPFLAFMLIYTFLPLAWGGMTWEQSLADLKRLPFNFPSMGGHLWFMYPLIGIYLIIPVVSPWLEKATAKEERIFLGLFVLSTFIPWIHRFITDELWGECFWNGFTALWYCSGYLGYLVLAHYIHYHLDWSRKRKLIVGWICFFIGAAFTGWSF